MSTVTLATVKDPTYPGGEVKRISAPYGQSVPLAFKTISYKGQTPTSHSGITWQLIIKADRDDADSDALTDVTNASLTLSTSPFSVGYDLGTTATGYGEGKLFYGELWADDATYGKNLVNEFQIRLRNSTRTTFS